MRSKRFKRTTGQVKRVQGSDTCSVLCRRALQEHTGRSLVIGLAAVGAAAAALAAAQHPPHKLLTAACAILIWSLQRQCLLLQICMRGPFWQAVSLAWDCEEAIMPASGIARAALPQNLIGLLVHVLRLSITHDNCGLSISLGTRSGVDLKGPEASVSCCLSNE